MGCLPARVVAVLREPISRMLSHFNSMRATYYLPEPSQTAVLRAPPSRCFERAQAAAGVTDGNVTFEDVARCAIQTDDALLAHGHYVEGIQRWRKRPIPPEHDCYVPTRHTTANPTLTPHR